MAAAGAPAIESSKADPSGQGGKESDKRKDDAVRPEWIV